MFIQLYIAKVPIGSGSVSGSGSGENFPDPDPDPTKKVRIRPDSNPQPCFFPTNYHNITCRKQWGRQWRQSPQIEQ